MEADQTDTRALDQYRLGCNHVLLLTCPVSPSFPSRTMMATSQAAGRRWLELAPDTTAGDFFFFFFFFLWKPDTERADFFSGRRPADPGRS